MLIASHDVPMTLGGSLHDAQQITRAGQIGHCPTPAVRMLVLRVLDISA
jgi:hypothetical protein